MKVQDIMAILGVAAATMAFTLAFAAPEQVAAVDQEENDATRITPLIDQPTLKIAGLEITLTMDKPNYAPGDKPIITLKATNPTDRRVETNVWIGMTASSFSSRLSRAPMMPRYQWSEDIPWALEPGETENRQIATETEFVAGNTVSITMSDTDQKAAFAKLLNSSVGAPRVPNPVSVAPVASDDAAVVNRAATEISGG